MSSYSNAAFVRIIRTNKEARQGRETQPQAKREQKNTLRNNNKRIVQE